MKKDFKAGDEHSIAGRLSYFADMGLHLIELDPPGEQYDHPNNIHWLLKMEDGRNLDNLPIIARITAEGHSYYLRSYLARDWMDGQEELSKSILTTNRFVIGTALAVLFGFIIQGYSIYINHQDAQEGLRQSKIQYQQNKSGLPQSPHIYTGDSLSRR